MFLAFLRSALGLAPLFIYGASGETVTEKSGHLNMGIPGIMCMGMAGGMFGCALYSAFTGGNMTNINGVGLMACMLFFTILIGALAGLLFSFFAVNLRCNQNVIGLTLTTFGIGFYALVFTILEKNGGFTIARYSQYCSTVNYLFISEADCTNWAQTIFGSYGFLWYLCFFIAFGAAIFIRHTRIGLNLRAVGENAASSDAAGINVAKYRYIATTVGATIAALGGLYYMVEMKVGLLEFNELDGFGWLAVALVIFTLWQTDLCVVGAIVFAMLYKLPSFYPLPNQAANILFQYLPYLVTIVILVLVSIFNKRNFAAPKDLGITYFRENR